MSEADRINKIDSADDLTVNESSATIPDPDPDSVPFPEENRSEDGNMSATLFQYKGHGVHELTAKQGMRALEHQHLTNETVDFQCDEPMHIWQGMMTHLTNETVETVEELNEDIIIDIDNTNGGTNEDDQSTDGPMMSQVD